MNDKIYKYRKLPSYDELCFMFENNPDEVEIIRSDLSDQLINSASERVRPRLRGIMFKIKYLLQKSSNPMHGCILINRMMMDSFYDMNQSIVELNNSHVSYDESLKNKEVKIKKTEVKFGSIIEFPKK